MPALRQGKLYAGFLTLRPNCDACGLDYAFIDTGDGPAVSSSCLPARSWSARALIVEVKYQPPFWLHAALWLPLILATTLLPLRAMKSLLIALQFHHKAAPGPAGRPRTEMSTRPRGSRRAAASALFTLVMVASLSDSAYGNCSAASRNIALIAALTERLAAAPVALPPPSQWSTLTPARTNSAASVLRATYRAALDAMVYSSGSAIR